MTDPNNDSSIDGTIHVHAKGFGFVTPLNPEDSPQDIFIPKHLKKNAVDGDTVRIAINHEKKREKGPEGAVLEIIKRAKETLVGIVWVIDPKDNYILYIQSLGNTRAALVKKGKKDNYKIGDRLLLQVKDWGEESEPVLCSVLEKIGSIEDASTDITAASKDFGIRDVFASDVLDQVKSFPDEVPKEDLKDRTDLTQLETFTIDPKTARDYDDALSISKNDKGYQLAVHIADVSHYVKKGSPLDIEAQERSNSTYFPGQCVPMLPPVLSNHLCSLKEKVTRLTISVLIDFDLDGNVLNSSIKRAYIYSQKRFSYEEAKEVLDGKKKSPHLPSLKLMVELCYLLKEKRNQRGSVDLALPEVVLDVDKKGNPTGYHIVEYDITHQLVEEFMLKANEIVAEYFMTRNLPAVFRVHEEPSNENLEDFYSLARSLGFNLAHPPSQEDVQKLFNEAKKTPHAQQLSVAFIRSMKLAVYSDQNVGHYGLALENYCHFTSPIRRYSDLVIHRLLFEESPEENLAEVAKSCSEKERVSFKAEMSVVKLKKLRLLQELHKKDPNCLFDAVVSSVKPFGFFFEAQPLQIEGFIHISDMNDDYYEYDSKRQQLLGKHSGRIFKMAVPLQVTLSEIDLTLMECKWSMLSKKKRKSPRRNSKKKKSKKSRRRS